jgi:hypothetical protein
VSSPGDSVVDESDSDTIGRSVSLNFLMIGSSISAGRSERMPEMASRMSCVASRERLVEQELDHHRREAVLGGAVDVLHAADGRDGLLDRIEDFLLHAVG